MGNLQAERDFTDVRDVVRAYHLLALTGAGAVYNVGSGRARADTGAAGPSDLLQRGADRGRAGPRADAPQRYAALVCNYGRLHECTGWEPTIPFDAKPERRSGLLARTVR